MKKLKILIIIIDICAVLCFSLFYGPYNGFRDYLITTAMTTMTHKYLARTFYTENQINDVLQVNYIEEFDGTETNIGNISEKNNYNSIYEKEILDRNNNELYKIINLKVNDYDSYLVVIYDPSKIKVVSTKYLGVKGQYVTDIAKENNAIVAINGGGFIDDGGTGTGGIPTGFVIQNGRIVWGNSESKSKTIAINKNNELVLKNMTGKQALEEGIRDAMEFGPYLIVNGISTKIKGNGGYGINPRTIIAQRKDGIMMFLVIDGIKNKNWNLRGGASLNQVLEVLEKYGAYNAANLDGGASSVLAVNGELFNKPCSNGSKSGQRNVPNAWILTE